MFNRCFGDVICTTSITNFSSHKSQQHMISEPLYKKGDNSGRCRWMIWHHRFQKRIWLIRYHLTGERSGDERWDSDAHVQDGQLPAGEGLVNCPNPAAELFNLTRPIPETTTETTPDIYIPFFQGNYFEKTSSPKGVPFSRHSSI